MKWRSLEESASGTAARPLHEILAERKELIANYVRPETRAVHSRVVAELKEDGISDRVLSVGAKAPKFELKD